MSVRHPRPTELDQCRRCDLWRRATHGVPGEGPAHAAVMLVGEQPGDREDLAARPFVGPAGAMLDKLLGEAGIAREQVYVTNAVKHFKWEPRGKRRLHRRPNADEVQACRVWLELEMTALRPRVVVAMGATAVSALLKVATSIDTLRRRKLSLSSGTPVFVTYHPSAILRTLGQGDDRLRKLLLKDLKRVAAAARALRHAV